MIDWETAVPLILVAAVLIVSIGGLVFPRELEVSDDLQDEPMPGQVASILSFVGFPDSMLYMPAFIYYSLIPILAIWLIIYGFLARLQIFNIRWLNLTLSFLIALSTVPLGLFVSIVAMVFGIMGVYATVVFVALFIVGVAYFALASIKGFRGSTFGIEGVKSAVESELEAEKALTKDLEKRLENEEKAHKSLKGAYERARKSNKSSILNATIHAYRQHVQRLNNMIQDLQAEYDQLAPVAKRLYQGKKIKERSARLKKMMDDANDKIKKLKSRIK